MHEDPLHYSFQYTKGDAKAKVTTGGINAALDSYRHISYKGKHAMVQAQMQRRVRVMNPELAKNINDIEAKMYIWKHDLRLLTEARLEQDIAMFKDDDQMITILISMMPDPVADHLVEKYDVGESTLEEIEGILDDHLQKMDQKSKVSKKIGQVASSTSERKEEEDEEEWTECWDASGTSHWICSSAKRASPGDDEGKGNNDTERETMWADSNKRQKGKLGGKMKGKGKPGGGKAGGKGPKGGCHECGGDHYASACKIRAAIKGRDKGQKAGKGWDNVPPRYWNNYYPGFKGSQWSHWRPSGKGKGGGKGSIGWSGQNGNRYQQEQPDFSK